MKKYLRKITTITCYIFILCSFLVCIIYLLIRGIGGNIQITDVLIAELLSTGALLFSGILSQQFTMENNRLHDYHEIITKETRSNNLYVRKHFVALFTLSNTDVIESMRDDKKYVQKIINRKNKLFAHFKIIVPQEVELMESINKVCSNSIKYYYSPSKNLKDQLCAQVQHLYYLYSLYDYSDWRYIKAQANKTTIQDISDWKVLYDEQYDPFENSKKSLDRIF